MKSLLCSLITFMVCQAAVFAQESAIVLEGNYQGKPLYVQNPFAPSGVGFCVFEVTVNGEVAVDEIYSSAFEIDFTQFPDLNVGDEVIVKIKHREGCDPKVLNPEVLKPKSTFKVVSMNVTQDATLKWKTTNETGKLDFVVEQYRWNKWIKVGEVAGKGTPEEHDYQFKITPHSGENQFRVKQVDYTGKPRYSTVKKYRDPSIQEVTFEPKKVSKEIIFSGETLFEIYDQFGNIVRRGFDSKINCTNLKKGVFYLNYDNKTDSFVKK